MNKKTCFSVLAFTLVFAAGLRAQEMKTDLGRDVFVENSKTNFILTAKAARPSGKSKLAIDLSVADAGRYTLICFVDGKPSTPAEFKAPGTFELSTRGMAPGSYRVTLQLIDTQGRVGRISQNLELNSLGQVAQARQTQESK